MKQLVILIVLVLVAGVAFFSRETINPKPNVKGSAVVSPQQVKNSINTNEKLTLVDVRTPEEYEQGHLKNSVLLTLDTISSKAGITIPDKDQLLFVYCRTGVRSAKAVSQLAQMGYTNVHSIDGGITAWQNAGYPVEK